jgi:hypothetical protein
MVGFPPRRVVAHGIASVARMKRSEIPDHRARILLRCIRATGTRISAIHRLSIAVSAVPG